MILTTETADRDAIEVYPGLYLVSGKYLEKAVQNPEAVCPIREDLPEKHPLYGQRALPTVPAGHSDLLVDNTGVVNVGVL